MRSHESECVWEIVWSGELDKLGLCPSLLGERVSKPAGFWTEPPRLYNKKAEFWQTRIPKGQEATLKEALRQSDEPDESIHPHQISWLDNLLEDGDDLEMVGPIDIHELENGGSDGKS